MPTWIKGGARFLFVTVGIVILTSFTIDATDMLRGSQSALGILADRATGDCPSDMVVVEGSDGRFCIDKFEASLGNDCPIASPSAAVETAQNLNEASCYPESKPNVMPWIHVARHQAEALCARSGKRLPTATEWYTAALGTPDGVACNINGSLKLTSESDCRSGAGSFDMIGNVWEIVSSVAESGVVDTTQLPSEGYVTGVSPQGIPVSSAEASDLMYNKDYIWSETNGTYAVMRGGYYGGKGDAGIYTLHAKIGLDFASAAIGFRCAQTI